MIEAVIFDMDGLLIDSEPLWQQAQKNIFSTVGIDLTHQEMNKTTWMRIDQVVEYRFQESPWNEESDSKQRITQKIEQEVKNLIETQWKAKPWVQKILSFFSDKVHTIAIASSSAPDIIQAVIKKLDIQNYLSSINSAEDEEFWKPHPAVYLTTCEKIWVNPSKCIAFEDSLNGIKSAQAAHIRCIWIPEWSNISSPDFSIADMLLNSLEDFWKDQWEELNR